MYRIAREKELHRKISTGSVIETLPLAEPQLPTVPDGDEEAKGGDTSTEQASHPSTEADGLKVEEDPTAANAKDENKEDGASGTPAASKADVEADEATKVGPSGEQDEKIEGTQGSVDTAADTLHQHSTDHEVNADEAANAAQLPEGCQDPAPASCERPTASVLYCQVLKF